MSEFEYRRNPNDAARATKDRVAGILREHGLLSTESYVNQIYDEIVKNGGSRFGDADAIIRVAKYGCKGCRDKYETCGHIVPQNESLWTEVFETFEDYDTPSNRSLLLLESKLPKNTTNLQNALHDIIRDNPIALTVTPAREAVNHKRWLINIVTENGKHKTYPLWAANYGTFKYIAADTLENESDDMLVALAGRVPGWRKQIAGDRPEREKLPDGVTAIQHARERELESDEFLVFPGSDPPREYTMREAKANLRELMFYPGSNQGRGPRRTAAINRLLSGRKFGE